MATKTETDVTSDIKRLLDAGKLVLGTERTVKNLKSGNAKKVFLAKNCSAGTREDITRYAGVDNIEVVSLELTSAPAARAADAALALVQLAADERAITLAGGSVNGAFTAIAGAIGAAL